MLHYAFASLAPVAAVWSLSQSVHGGSGSAYTHYGRTWTSPRAFGGRSIFSMAAKYGSASPAVRGVRRSRCGICRPLVRSPKIEGFVRQIRHFPSEVSCLGLYRGGCHQWNSRTGHRSGRGGNDGGIDRWHSLRSSLQVSKQDVDYVIVHHGA